MTRLIAALALFALAPSLAAQTVRMDRTVFSASEPIVVEYASSNHPKDWVTVVPASNADNDYDDWAYLDGVHTGGGALSHTGNDLEGYGVITFPALAPGVYEARAYCCWTNGVNSGGYNVVSRVRFTVQ